MNPALIVFYGRSLCQLESGAANDNIAHQAADVEPVRTPVLIWSEHSRKHNGKHDVEHPNRDLRCRGQQTAVRGKSRREIHV